MPEPYTYPPQGATYPAAPGVHLPVTHQPYPAPTPRKSKKGLIIGAVAIVLTAGGIGGLIGNRIGAEPAGVAPQPIAGTPTPTTEQVHAATIDLCSRFAGAYAAMPSPQKTGFDVVPTANYISDALRDNPAADTDIRTAVIRSLELLREHVAVISGERAQGAIHIPTDWTASTANDADQQVWDLCRTYRD